MEKCLTYIFTIFSLYVLLANLLLGFCNKKVKNCSRPVWKPNSKGIHFHEKDSST